MSVLSWGKCKIEYKPSVNGAPDSSENWVELDTPKEDTTKLSATAGNEVEATEEGGAIVDFRRAKYKFDFETQLFVKKGVARPFADTDGVVLGEYAIRVTPEDTSCEGFQIDRCMLSIEDSYSSADGKIMTLRSKILKPAYGNQVKPFNGEVALTVTCTASDGTVKIANGTAGASVTANVLKGVAVPITAIPAAGKSFVKWNDNDTNATREVTLTEATTYTATFEAE